ncbi:MAG TPA: hypothetical protein VNX47_10380, partial [Nevskia sp.]|nr:hypothetical protein [Nevskia sp.]
MPIKIDGSVTQGTRQNLIAGLRSSPMEQTAVDAIVQQAITFTEKVVTTYDAQIAQGEVGIQGTGQASEA